LLKSLKSKGVVLAINSKNDPKNVHWKNATLNEDDFVASAISWMPKVQGMSAIQAELNLKMNSFVFIDDRRDELELMRTTYPEVLCLDAKEPKTWARFSCWLAALEDDLEMDRTLMYKQREQRKALVKDDVTSEEDKLKLFAALELKLEIKRPDIADLKRVAELINRTNQFNLAGVRVSLKEITDWYANDEYLILTGRTSDRFGDMGVTCIAIGKMVNQQFELMVFVLSCRVFGYQFEHAVMNHIKRQASDMGAQKIKAQYIATAQNSPCKSFLTECGFEQEQEFYWYDLNQPMVADASWLSVEI
jgi:FkbH-like protein